MTVAVLSRVTQDQQNGKTTASGAHGHGTGVMQQHGRR